MKKTWNVTYDHEDGRNGTIRVTTEVEKVDNQYGNQKYGRMVVERFAQVYDLRYNKDKDLHMAMLNDYFGKGLVKAEEVR